MSSILKIVKNPEKFRNNIVNKINEIVNDEKKSMNIEKSVYNYSIKEANIMKVVKKWDNEYFVIIYSNRLRSIYNNMKNNSQFLNKIINNEISYKELESLTHQEIDVEHREELIKEKIKMDKKLFDEKKIESMSDMIKCRKCKGRECTYYELQTRSCDEPATQYYTCLICDHKWKQ